jgi:hypothetical protein
VITNPAKFAPPKAAARSQSPEELLSLVFKGVTPRLQHQTRQIVPINPSAHGSLIIKHLQKSKVFAIAFNM